MSAVRTTSRVGVKAFAAAGLLIALILAGFVSHYASSSPDGLEKVAADKGFDAGAKDHPAAGSPLADYGVSGVKDARLSGGLSGVIGVGVVVVIGGGLFWGLRRRTAAEGRD
ncbi:hypothetical protein GCM10022221_38610 [Actinocorallia aurea]